MVGSGTEKPAQSQTPGTTPTRSGKTRTRPAKLSAAALHNLEHFGLPAGLDERVIADNGAGTQDKAGNADKPAK